MTTTRSSDRVVARTAPRVQAGIDRRIDCNIRWFSEHPERIEARLGELDEEWDVERVLETNASTLSLVGLTLAFFGRKRWLLLPLAVQSFFLQHALQGWCPPLPLMRRLGVRTQAEIERERHALLSIRDGRGAGGAARIAEQARPAFSTE